MKAREILARAGVMCVVTALGACAGSKSYNVGSQDSVAAPVQNVAVAQPDIVPASSALGRVTADLDVSVRRIQPTLRPSYGALASEDVQPRVVLISHRLQCVPFARERSGVAIRGNANTWWNQAAGDFVRLKQPAVGSVIVMKTSRGHVAVITKLVDNRTAIIDHANWMSNGQIYLDQPIMDVSANNDWSKVVIWNPGMNDFGKRALGVSGFILNASAHGNRTVFASLADVPSSMTGDVQFAQAVVKTTPRAEAPVLMAAVEKTPAKAKEAAPVFVAAVEKTETPAIVAAVAKPAKMEAPVIVASADIAPAKPTFVNVRVPTAKPTAIGAAKAKSADAPVYVAMIVPHAKPSSLSVSTMMAKADGKKAKPVYVAMIVPHAKPHNLGATQVALVSKKDAKKGAASTETAFIPTVKPTSITAFR